MKSWVKLYTEINRDVDVGTLTWAQRGIWTALLALCGEFDHRDEQEQETGQLDTLARVAWSIRCDPEELAEAVHAFEQRGMIAVDDEGVLYLTNYRKRQARPPSARPSAVTERVQRHRRKRRQDRNENVTSLQRGVTPSDPDPDPDPDPDSDPATDTDGACAPLAAAEEPEMVPQLVEFGIDMDVARALAGTCRPEHVRGWLQHARASPGLKNPAGLVVARLRGGIPPPVQRDNGSRRYIEGEYAQFIEH